MGLSRSYIAAEIIRKSVGVCQGSQTAVFVLTDASRVNSRKGSKGGLGHRAEGPVVTSTVPTSNTMARTTHTEQVSLIILQPLKAIGLGLTNDIHKNCQHAPRHAAGREVCRCDRANLIGGNLLSRVRPTRNKGCCSECPVFVIEIEYCRQAVGSFSQKSSFKCYSGGLVALCCSNQLRSGIPIIPMKRRDNLTWVIVW